MKHFFILLFCLSTLALTSQNLAKLVLTNRHFDGSYRLPFAALTVLNSNASNKQLAPEGEYTIKGKMANAAGFTIFLDKWNNLTKSTVVDSAMIDKKGNFAFKNKITSRNLYMLRVDEKHTWIVVLEPGTKVTFNGDFNDIMKYTFGGDQATITLNNFVKEMGVKNRRVGELNQEFINAQYSGADQNQLQAMQNEYTALQQSMINSLITFADTTADPLLAVFAISNLNIEEHANFIKKIADKALAQDSSLSLAKEIAAKVAEATKLAIGRPAPDFTLKSPTGETIQLSSLKGQVVLIDFWASWCKPCRNENPNLVKTYGKYKDKGFTIYSVSLDKNKDAWVNAIGQDNLSWPYHGSNLLFWNCPVAGLYNIKSIPATFLIDREGNIVSKNLRGAALEQKLAEIFGF